MCTGSFMTGVQTYYLIGFTLVASVLNIFIENESVGIKVLCTALLFTTFVFASLYHNLKTDIARNKAHKIKEYKQSNE